MIYALGQPAALAGLVAALFLGLGIRHVTQAVVSGRTASRAALPHWRRDVDPIGILAAVLGGSGWGTEPPSPRMNGRTRTLLTALSGPLAVFAAGAAVLAAYAAKYPGSLAGELYRPSDVLRGVPGPAGEQLLFTTGVALMCFAVVALVPLPPTDGWAVFTALRDGRAAGERPSGVREVLTTRRVGAVVLFVALVLPIGTMPPLHRVLDFVLTPVVHALA